MAQDNDDGTDIKWPDGFSLYRSQWPTNDAHLLAVTITESIHQDFEGWTPEEREVIVRYLVDVAIGCQASKT